MNWDIIEFYYTRGFFIFLAIDGILYIGSILMLLYYNARHFALYERYIDSPNEWEFSDLGSMTLVFLIGGLIASLVWPITLVVGSTTGLFKLFVKYMHWKYGKERMMLKLKGEEEGTDA